MNKRLLTLLLTLIMLVSSVPAAMAAKLEVEEDTSDVVVEATTNNIYEWGDFEDPASVDMIYFDKKTGGSMEQVFGGANGTDHALKWDSTGSARVMFEQDWNIPLVMVPGETYNISMYAKSDTEAIKEIKLYIRFKYSDGKTGSTGLNKNPQMETLDWTKYELTYTCPATYSGKTVVGTECFVARVGGTLPTEGVIYVDELSVVPAGNVPVDYSSVNEGYNPVGTTPGVVTAPTDTGKVTFTDVKNHWAKTTIEALAQNGYVDGMGDGTYSPDTQVTRAQFIKMVTDLYGSAGAEYDGRYSDVSGNEWFAGPIAAADSLNLLDKALTFGGKISPDAPITREEAASIAARVAKDRGATAKSGISTSFTDNNSITEWAKASVKEAASYGLITGYTDGSYKPTANITRAEAATILFRVIEISSRMHIYVDAENGNDRNDGTQAAPLATVEAARDMAKKYAPTMQNDITILMRGEFYFDSTLEFDYTHSGQNGYKIVYTSWGEEKPVFTMAKEYTDFQLHDAEKNIYKVYVGVGADTRQAYFNEVKGIRARTVGYPTNCEYNSDESYYICDNTEFLDLKYPQDAECVWHVNWLNQRATLKSITETEDGRVKLQFFPAFYYVRERINKRPGAVCQAPSYLENAYEFLDQKGEWYMNRHDGFMYYIPRDGEDMSNMTLKFPYGEMLMSAKGYDYDHVLSNITFDNIRFDGTTWMYPTEMKSYNAEQNGILKEKEDRNVNPGGAIEFDLCQYITLSNNEFKQLGRRGIMIWSAAKHFDVVGNEFADISGGAFFVDDYNNTGNPDRDQRSICEYVNFTNNYIHHVSQDYKGDAAVTFGWPQHSKFNHNEIYSVPYTGFHGAYGWAAYGDTGTCIYDVELNYNYIHDIFVDRVYDGACFYTVGASKFHLEDPQNPEYMNRCFGNYLVNSWEGVYLYPDEGTTGWFYKNNVVDASRVVHGRRYNFSEDPPRTNFFMHMHTNTITWIVTEDNWATHDYAYTHGMMNGTACVLDPVNIYPDANWPDEAKAVIAGAGIEPEYRDNFDMDGITTYIAPEKLFKINELEKPVDLGILLQDGELNQYPVSSVDFDWWCDVPGAVTVDENGFITAHQAGQFELEGIANFGNGYTQMWHYKLTCGDTVESIAFNVDTVNLLAGATGEYKIYAYTKFGERHDITDSAEINLKPESDLVTFGEVERKEGIYYTITATDIGETRITGTITYMGSTFDIDIPVKIIEYSNDESASLPFTEYDMTKGWINGGIAQADGGYRVQNPSGSNSAFNCNTRLVKNELMAFDLVLKPSQSWPSFAFSIADPMLNYSKGDCYMIGFQSEFIELQKFNKGARTMFFGASTDDYKAVAGPGIPNVEPDKIFEYEKRHSIVVGALEAENGTRIILNIDGVNIIDYTDTTSNALPASGYFAIYNAMTESGGFYFYPYSGITRDAEVAE